MNENATAYLKYLSTVLGSEEELLPILTSVFEAGLNGSLCVPKKPEWEPTLMKFASPFVMQEIDGISHIYFEKIYTLKRRLETALSKQMNQKNSIEIDMPKMKSIQLNLESIYSKNLSINFKLNQGQSSAIHQTLMNHFQIISGGPGTGKTTVVAFLLRIMKELEILPNPEDIALVAPTGRAAQRLTESIQQNLKRMGAYDDFTNLFHGQTVHSLLNYRTRESRFYYNKERSLPYRLILVDEVSMMDLDLMVSLFDALENINPHGEIPFHFILLGDSNQLPSVEKGEVLADFLSELPNKGKFVSHLTESNRHTSGSQLLHLIQSIVPDLESTNGNVEKTNSTFTHSISLEDAMKTQLDVIWYHAKMERQSHSKRDLVLEEIWNHHFVNQMKLVQSWKIDSEASLRIFPIETFLRELNQFRCLTIFRSGYYGIEGIQEKIQSFASRYFQNQSSTQTDPIYFRDLSSRLYYEGMPVIITKNDRSRKLFNGDVGFICKIADELRAVFSINNQLSSYAIDTLPLHEPAHFMTVHKSQGSEYDTVFFYIPDINFQNQNAEDLKREYQLLNKKILYTAVTRAKRKVILVCDEKTWDFGLSNHQKRVTGFRIE